MGSLLQDLRFALRTLRKSPGFTAIAVLTLALGIGANTTIFSWINSTLLNPIPGASNTGELLEPMLGTNPADPNPLSYPDYLDFRRRNRSFSSLAAFELQDMDLTGKGKPERIWGYLASWNYFDMLGVRPILGRGFIASDDATQKGSPFVVISYRLWQNRFGGDAGIVGRSIDIDKHPYTIIGVAPALFQGTQTGLSADLWIPIVMEQQIISPYDRLHDRGSQWVMMMGRLKPGATLASTQQDLGGIMQQLVRDYPNDHRGRKDVTVFPLWQAPFGANAYFYVLLPILMAIAGVVLLLACANVANLLLVRSVSRQREVSIRLAIGAGRWRLVRQFLIESLVLALGGGTLAFLMTTWTARMFITFVPPSNLPVSLVVAADHRVLIATLVISTLASVIFGTLPAMRASGLSPALVLKQEGASTTAGLRKARLARGLVVTQIAMSLLLLIVAGLFIRGFQRSQHVDLGFNSEHVYLGSFDLFPAGYSSADGVQFYRQLLNKLETIPGVQSVTIADWVPLGFVNRSDIFKPQGYVPQAHESMEVEEADVGPNYFPMMQVPIVEGRGIEFTDTEKSQPVAVVNQAFASKYWPHQDALGKKLEASGTSFIVVGIAKDVHYNTLESAHDRFVYLPITQDYSHSATIFARVSGNPAAFADTIEKKVHELNADLPLYDVGDLKTRVLVASTNARIGGVFVGMFGALALVLAAIGIYGVIAYSTRQRTHEFGIRIALGAQRHEILQLVLKDGVRLTLIGLAIGLALALSLTRFLQSQLFGVAATDALTFGSVIVLLSAAALLACYLPARRATRVDPMISLRTE
ncbi:MAG TPA: ABC transporter permease [Terriglobales bacterium]|nr:ABC transporter permease [Terriglobales bacterium]